MLLAASLRHAKAFMIVTTIGTITRMHGMIAVIATSIAVNLSRKVLASALDWPPLPQGVVDTLAGYGDRASNVLTLVA